jgi:hypothetical protein
MSEFQIITYVSSDPDTPPKWRAVAHCFQRHTGPLPATQYAETAAEAHAKLEAFLMAEVAAARAKREQRIAAAGKGRAAQLAARAARQADAR